MAPKLTITLTRDQINTILRILHASGDTGIYSAFAAAIGQRKGGTHGA